MSQELLRVADLTTTFRTTRGPLTAVAGVSLTVHRGEALGIVGESGSGKSVLARTIMDLLPGSAEVGAGSEIHFQGRDPRRFWGGQVAMVFQDPMTSLNPVRTIGRQLTDPIRRHLGLRHRAARDHAVELLTQVGIGEPARRLRQYPHELSGGMRQRVMIAIAISGEPSLLIADEPTTALDVSVQKEILDLLTRLRRERRMAMILISHDLAVVAGRTDRTMVMYAGQIAETGPTPALFQRTRHPYTAALRRAAPRIDLPSHTRLAVIPGSPPDLADPPPGCRFAPRCDHAQPDCLASVPPLRPNDAEPAHEYACFYPAGTEEGDQARAANLAAGRTSAGLDLTAVAAGRDLEAAPAQPVGA